mgnify:FL=1
MGVLNITPDSFSDGGIYSTTKEVLIKIEQFINNGVDIVDIGAQSTRPGANEVGSKIETERLIPVLSLVRKNFPNLIISVDTFNSDVARYSLENGADWINDVSGGRLDSKMFDVIANYKCPYILTHSRGNSKNMNNLSFYNSLLNDIFNESSKLIELAISKGVNKNQLIFDPGLGFSKTTEQNIKILNNLDYFKSLGFPMLIGPSRKRFIGEVTKVEEASKRIMGTAVVVCKCIQFGVDIVRVHDVKEINETILMAKELW